MLVQYILKQKQIKTHDIAALESIIPRDLSECGQTLKRSTTCCYMRWNQVVLPALKTHIKGLPSNCDWKLDLMAYLVKHKVKHLKDLDMDFLVKEIVPGQTHRSIAVFINTIPLQTVDGTRTRSKLPLNELVQIKLKNRLLYLQKRKSLNE